MSTKVKGNNKGFSLVELIVVMAIMAILAVTLAPRLSQYIDKARQANDREAVNAVYTAIKLGMMDDAIYKPAKDGIAADLTAGGTGKYVVKLVDDGLYTVSGSDNNIFTAATTGLDTLDQQIVEVLGSFKLQSNKVAHPDIIVTVESPTLFKVELDYDTWDGADVDPTIADPDYESPTDYKVDSSDVAVD